MPRTHGYALRGRPCPGLHDWHARGRINVIGALLAGAMLGVGLTASNVDADIFNLWLAQDLNKIEPKWAQAKAIRRRTGQTVDQIFQRKDWNQN